MLVYKCDICRRQIKDRSKSLDIQLDFYHRWILCHPCSEQILVVLQKKGVYQPVEA
jgi:DNA-directed RNA polymerase subunit RPC12/RpoP